MFPTLDRRGYSQVQSWCRTAWNSWVRAVFLLQPSNLLVYRKVPQCLDSFQKFKMSKIVGGEISVLRNQKYFNKEGHLIHLIFILKRSIIYYLYIMHIFFSSLIFVGSARDFHLASCEIKVENHIYMYVAIRMLIHQSCLKRESLFQVADYQQK